VEFHEFWRQTNDTGEYQKNNTLLFCFRKADFLDTHLMCGIRHGNIWNTIFAFRLHSTCVCVCVSVCVCVTCVTWQDTSRAADPPQFDITLLMGRVLQSITQLSISIWWYVLDQPHYMFRPIEAIIRFVQVDLWEWCTYNVRNGVSMVRSQHLLRVGLVCLNLICK